MDTLASLRSRLLHYRNRLGIIKPPTPLLETKETLSALVNVLLDDVICALPNQVNRNEVEGRRTAVEEKSSKENAENEVQNLKKQGRGQDDDGAYSLRGINSGSPELTATSSPIASARGRGSILKDLQQTRLSISGRGGTTGLPPLIQGPFSGWRPNINSNGLDNTGRNNNGQESNNNNNSIGSNNDNNINNNTYRNIITNNAWLYADLLERLSRRERAQPAARAEDRRMMKAVHNWPFKFRGEKDTTSLNIFLDRVARSEGMTDGTLLTSIKHLLQEDALDWYARAMSQQQLYSWEAFKREIRKEFLPSGYAQILRLEASFRFQGQNESFAKYYRDIAALFRFVSPPMSEEEKFFIVKKNMNADYAAIVTAARPANLQDMVEVCTSYDETRMLLNRQRRIPVPHNALLEPNFATPGTAAKTFNSAQPQRFPRVNVMESTEGQEAPATLQRVECGVVRLPVVHSGNDGQAVALPHLPSRLNEQQAVGRTRWCLVADSSKVASINTGMLA